MKPLFSIFFLCITALLLGQTFDELPAMPEPVSNNAVTVAKVNGVQHVYSFSGIDTTKIYSGIHQRAFRYNTQTQVWDTIDPLPSGNGRIAAGASTVKNKIYIIGGYEVFSNGSEISVDKVHIYNPETNSYELDGEPIPVAIDDHIQAVWRDSLIYVVTGWSDNDNVPDVQIYNPTENTWLAGTPVPNNNFYKVFGGSGTIIGDTIFYNGGARFGFNFPISNILRKGVIDPNDPTNISWSFDPDETCLTYRAITHTSGNSIFWIGGSETTYNFNGIAYNGTGGVSPRTDWCTYLNGNLNTISPDNVNSMPEVMDLRGIASLENGQAIIVGGMLDNQKVTDKAFLINFDALLSNKNLNFDPIKLFPNPTSDFFRIEEEGKFQIQIWDTIGRLSLEKNLNGFEKVEVTNLEAGFYFVKYLKMNNGLERKD